jgi:hypothetical protein
MPQTRILRLLEYVYDDPEEAARDQLRWRLGIEKRGMKMRSAVLPFESVPFTETGQCEMYWGSHERRCVLPADHMELGSTECMYPTPADEIVGHETNFVVDFTDLVESDAPISQGHLPDDGE